MTGEVVLSSALRSNLLSLQNTQSSIDKVQNTLATGLKVASALDNPQNFFASQGLKNRSNDLGRLLDGLGQSIQTIKAADKGVTALTKLVEQADSIATQARDAVATGGKEAVLTGNVSLKGVKDLTDVIGISNTDAIDFVVKSADGTLTTASVQIATGDSIEQLIGKINDIADSDGNQLIDASLTSSGMLKLKGKDGADVNMAFNAAGGPTTSEDLALANALGFGTIARVTENGAATTRVEVTAVANTKLVSGTFYEGGTTDIATASTLLTNVDDATGANRFQVGASATDNANITISINNADEQTIAIGGTSIQGLVDSINTNASLNTQIRASYDSATGQFSIEALDSSVQAIEIGVTETTGDGNIGIADFGFGTKTLSAGAAAGEEAETFILGSAATTLGQLESDYNNLLEQIDGLVEDSGYRGTNLLQSQDLVTYFNEDRSNNLSTKGADLSSDGLGLAKADFSSLANIEDTATAIRGSLSTLRTFSSTLANSLAVIQTREDFTKDMVATLTEGSDKLTVADQNEEGAKLLALQTRQQLGVTALSMAAQAQQSVLRLF